MISIFDYFKIFINFINFINVFLNTREIITIIYNSCLIIDVVLYSLGKKHFRKILHVLNDVSKKIKYIGIYIYKIYTLTSIIHIIRFSFSYRKYVTLYNVYILLLVVRFPIRW